MSPVNIAQSLSAGTVGVAVTVVGCERVREARSP